MPHPDSLLENKTQRGGGGRNFSYVPREYMREGGDASKPVEVRMLALLGGTTAQLTSAACAAAKVRVRTTILSLRNINLVDQTFTCHFFLEGALLLDSGTPARPAQAKLAS